MLTSPTILVVDDDWTILELFTRLFTRAGYHVVTTANQNDVTHICCEQSIQLLLIDYHMPGGDNKEIIQTVRTHNPTLPIIVQSAQMELDPDELRQTLPIQGYYRKGERLSKLLDCVAGCVPSCRK
jgi:CheY-like chemotaxis protein